ncbi:UDP-glucose 4-epimerase [Pseudoalteromonas denitrificans DSM 6059]|uniref:UDP-glucose 4-epimerase n=1 Tax=Pseudoalteromonas denitrificans DSM 6059 TaxID=1123010 RepID=A0A1I1JQN9_9GAMM|nr:UDP-glucose 4-epimerase [Pseudoalteromonas denitrificans DSM 6059]
MAVYRLTRGIDVRDVASAHACTVEKRLPGFRRFIISGPTPFNKCCCENLYQNADVVLREYAQNLVETFESRGWDLPKSLDRVYDSTLAQKELGWLPIHGYESVLNLLDDEISEVLPVRGYQ